MSVHLGACPPPPPYQKAGYATVASFRSPNEDGQFRPPHSLHEIAATGLSTCGKNDSAEIKSVSCMGIKTQEKWVIRLLSSQLTRFVWVRRLCTRKKTCHYRDKLKTHWSESVDSDIFFSVWIEHLFLIILTPRSSNLVENFLFYE